MQSNTLWSTFLILKLNQHLNRNKTSSQKGYLTMNKESSALTMSLTRVQAGFTDATASLDSQ